MSTPTSPAPDPLDTALAGLKAAIKKQPQKQQDILTDWLDTWSVYLDFERSFDPRRLVYYKRGDIVLAHFGYNVGNELGGTHYAVVVESDNNLSSGIVTVVPLSSLDAGKTQADLHKSEVYMGKLVGGVDCLAMPLQMRPVSKLRIIKPKYKKHGKITVPGALLDKIDEQIKMLFTKNSP
jgi:mRNA-degrading endonuclease toxin of MazEF toxin-antitoxin module